MDTLANTKQNSLSVIDGLAAQARALRLAINANMWQLAKVFLEAKELVPHGEWEAWLSDNADVSVRTAQDMIAAYKRFGGKPQFEGLGQAKTFKLLPVRYEDVEIVEDISGGARGENGFGSSGK